MLVLANDNLRCTVPNRVVVVGVKVFLTGLLVADDVFSAAIDAGGALPEQVLELLDVEVILHPVVIDGAPEEPGVSGVLSPLNFVSHSVLVSISSAVIEENNKIFLNLAIIITVRYQSQSKMFNVP